MARIKMFFGLLALIMLMAMPAHAGQNNGEEKMRESARIYLAGGCFWGVQEYYSRIPGVIETKSGYAQSNVPDPTYDMVCSGKTGAAETVEVVYDPQNVSMLTLVRQFFKIINPFTANRQGNDVGSQYRLGIYYTADADRAVIEDVIAKLQANYDKPFVVQVQKLENFYPAETCHQDYLKKNPGGYCHIDFSSLKDLEKEQKPELKYARPNQQELQSKLSRMEYHVTQEAGTEAPFTGQYWNNHKPGIYVDVVSGQPLFSSSQKFDSGTGWPSFAKPLADDAIVEKKDDSHGMQRIEARSSGADSHLGHVFNDGPKELGGLRYCINSAALRFIPYDEMDKAGYGEYKKFVDVSAK